jgi:hypothetical protein
MGAIAPSKGRASRICRSGAGIGDREHTSNRVLQQRGNGSLPEERSSIVDSVVEVGNSAAGAPLTEEFKVEAGAQR